MESRLKPCPSRICCSSPQGPILLLQLAESGQHFLAMLVGLQALVNPNNFAFWIDDERVPGELCRAHAYPRVIGGGHFVIGVGLSLTFNPCWAQNCLWEPALSTLTPST